MMLAGLVNSTVVGALQPSRATVQVGLFPVGDDPIARIRQVEEQLAVSEAAYDALCDTYQSCEAERSQLIHQVRAQAETIRHMREHWVPRCVVDAITRGVRVRT